MKGQLQNKAFKVITNRNVDVENKEKYIHSVNCPIGDYFVVELYCMRKNGKRESNMRWSLLKTKFNYTTKKCGM